MAVERIDTPVAHLPPHDLEAEQSVLGAMLVNPNAITAVAETLSADDFYRDSHRLIYHAALTLFDKGEEVDVVTLSAQLEREGVLERAGGRKLVHTLAELVPAGCLDQNPIQAAECLADDDRWCYAPLAFGYTNYSRTRFRRRRLAYVDMPKGPGGIAGSCLGGAGIAVSAFSPAREAALDHAFWLASAATQRGIYYTSGGQPANLAAWDDAALNDDCLGFFRNTRRTLDEAWLRPRFDGWLDVQDAVGTVVNRALRGEINDDACLRLSDDAVARSRDVEGRR